MGLLCLLALLTLHCLCSCRSGETLVVQATSNGVSITAKAINASVVVSVRHVAPPWLRPCTAARPTPGFTALGGQYSMYVGMPCNLPWRSLVTICRWLRKSALALELTSFVVSSVVACAHRRRTSPLASAPGAIPRTHDCALRMIVPCGTRPMHTLACSQHLRMEQCPAHVPPTDLSATCRSCPACNNGMPGNLL